MTFRQQITSALLAGLFGSSLCVFGQTANTPPANTSTKAAVPAPKATSTAPKAPVRRAAPRQPERYYFLIWGVNGFHVNLDQSGDLVRFTYRVILPEKAKVLNDNNLVPSLEAPQAAVSLTMAPQQSEPGNMRATVEPESGKSYWVTFSNKGHKVKKGDLVNVVIGRFKASGLLVE